MKTIIQIILLILVPSHIFYAAAQPVRSDEGGKLPVDGKVKIGKLSNGMTYYIRENKTPEKNASFWLVVRAGSILEDDDQDGLAHFTEHMCFNGTAKYPKNDLVSFLAKLGVRFGYDLNGGTRLEYTTYELPISIADTQNVANALDVLYEWAHNVSFNSADIESERGVLISEWRQRNSFFFRLMNKHAATLYRGSKFARRNVIGDTAILRGCKHEALKRFYLDWYRPDLMALVVVGDFDAGRMESMILGKFASIPQPSNPRQRQDFELMDQTGIRVSVATDREMPFEVGIIFSKLETFDLNTPSGYREVLKRYLFDAMINARLAENSKKPDPPYIAAQAQESSFYGKSRLFYVQYQCRKGGIMKATESVYNELYRVVQHGFTDTELARAKADITAKYQKSFNERNERESSDYASDYTQNFVFGDPIPGIENELKMVETMMPEILLSEVNSLAGKYIKNDNTVITLSLPEPDGKALPTEDDVVALVKSISEKKLEPYRDEVSSASLIENPITPGYTKVSRYSAGTDYYELNLGNGARVIMKQTPFKSGEILIRAFSPGGLSLAADPQIVSAGIADNLIVESGLGKMNKTTLDKMLMGKVVNIAPYFGNTTHGIDAQTRPADLETTLQMLYLYFTGIRADADAASSLLSRMASMYESRYLNPENLYADSLNYFINGSNQRMRPLQAADFGKLKAEDIYAFYKSCFSNAGNFTFLIVGDIDPDKTTKLVEKYIGSLPSNSKEARVKDRGIRFPEKGLNKTIYAGKEDRSHVHMMYSGRFESTAENRFILQALVDVLQLRITDLIREDKGGVYSPQVYLLTRKYPVQEYSINVNFVCQPARVGELTQTVQTLVSELRTKADEVSAEKVKTANTVHIPIDLQKNEFWLESLFNSLMYAENTGDILKADEYNSRINGTSIQKSAERYLDPSALVKVVMMPQP